MDKLEIEICYCPLSHCSCHHRSWKGHKYGCDKEDRQCAERQMIEASNGAPIKITTTAEAIHLRNLIPEILICSVCGTPWNIQKGEKPTCEHFESFVQEIRSDPKFKEW